MVVRVVDKMIPVMFDAMKFSAVPDGSSPKSQHLDWNKMEKKWIFIRSSSLLNKISRKTQKHKTNKSIKPIAQHKTSATQLQNNITSCMRF